MNRIPKALLALGVAGAFAACNGADGPGTGDTAEIRDTTITTVPDTVMIERTTTVDVDTVHDPDLHRDTVRGTTGTTGTTGVGTPGTGTTRP